MEFVALRTHFLETISILHGQPRTRLESCAAQSHRIHDKRDRPVGQVGRASRRHTLGRRGWFRHHSECSTWSACHARRAQQRRLLPPKPKGSQLHPDKEKQR